MKDLKTYFFIAGVAHEGNDKDWVRAEDVAELMDKMGKETADTLVKEMVKFDKAFDRLTDEVNKAAARIIEADQEVKELKDTQAMLSTCGYVEWKQFQRENGE